MTMPIDLLLVRHGQSEGNAANKASRAGDHSHFTPEFRARHSSQWRLTDAGIEQAKAAGKWLAQNIDFNITRRYVSEYIRAKETASYLNVGDPWYAEDYLREREYGELDVMTDDERKRKYAEVLAKRHVHPWYWRPPNGESEADLILRSRPMYDKLHDDFAQGHLAAILVLHGDLISAMMRRNQRMSMDSWIAWELSSEPKDSIHNCQIIHYTRRNPRKSSEILPAYSWVRSICPWDSSLSDNRWRSIVRYRPTSLDLRAEAERVPRLVNV